MQVPHKTTNGRGEPQPAIQYTYPQLPIQKAATRPGSILDRQGGSIFNRRGQAAHFALHIGHLRGAHTRDFFGFFCVHQL